MAKKSINKEIFNNQFKGVKRPVYSIDNHGLLDNLIVEDYEISDKLSNLNFEYGLNLDNYVDGAPVPAIPETITLIDGNASAYLKTIAAGFTTVEKNTTGTSDVVRVENWNAAPDVSINGVDAANIYGGIVVTTDCNCKTINFSTSTNRYENIEAIVEGPRTITVNTVKARPSTAAARATARCSRATSTSTSSAPTPFPTSSAAARRARSSTATSTSTSRAATRSRARSATSTAAARTRSSTATSTSPCTARTRSA